MLISQGGSSRRNNRTFLMASAVLSGFALGGLLDVQRTVHGFLQNLSQNGEAIDIGTRFHYSDELFRFTLSYLVILLFGVITGFVCLVKHFVDDVPSANQRNRLPLRVWALPPSLLMATLFICSLVGGMVFNRYRTEEMFAATGLAGRVSSGAMLEPWREAVHLYPNLVIIVGVGVVAIWSAWLALRWWRQSIATQ